jgi:hypothetical protein
VLVCDFSFRAARAFLQGALLATINIGVVLVPLAEFLHWKRHEFKETTKRFSSRAKRASSAFLCGARPRRPGSQLATTARDFRDGMPRVGGQLQARRAAADVEHLDTFAIVPMEGAPEASSGGHAHHRLEQADGDAVLSVLNN